MKFYQRAKCICAAILPAINIKKLTKPWRFPGTIPGKAIFIIFAGLVILNFILILIFLNHSKKEERLADSDEVITQLADTLYLFETTPEKDWPKIAKVSRTEKLDVGLTDAPRWSLQITDHNLEKMGDTLKQIPDHLAVSLRLDNGEWLNIKYTPLSNANLMQIFIVTLTLVVALALLFSAWTLLRFTGPLKQFKVAAEKLGIELTAKPMIEYGPAIVRDTAHAMNQMQQRIMNLLQDRNLMLAAISHDLRTPITRMKLRSQFLEDKQQYQEMVEDLDEMEAMIDQILTYTKDASNVDDRINLDLVALILSICDEKCEQGKNVECQTQIPRIRFKANALGIKRAITNLVNNAVKYAENVFVNITSDEGCAIIMIEDDGPGIPEAQLLKVFTPFYRVDTARSSRTGGSGLGLAIAQDVICAHGGSIQLKNRSQGGLQVKVTFRL